MYSSDDRVDQILACSPHLRAPVTLQGRPLCVERTVLVRCLYTLRYFLELEEPLDTATSTVIIESSETVPGRYYANLHAYYRLATHG